MTSPAMQMLSALYAAAAKSASESVGTLSDEARMGLCIAAGCQVETASKEDGSFVLRTVYPVTLV
jgi:hypothetical protein